MKILLISKTAVIKQIFKLISNKLNMDLTILDVNIVSSKFDIIISEDIVYDKQFPIQSYAKRFGIITKDSSLYKQNCDFLLSKPFLPSVLLEIIQKQIKLIIPEEDIEEISEDILIENEIEESEEFINSLVEDISDDILDEEDDSIVSSSFLTNGGILDTNELSKIQDILDITDGNENTTQSIEDADEEWVDLANIIDQAIDEVQDYKFNVSEPIKLILNNYTMNEISPLLNKLNQNIIDSLVGGDEITLKLKVEQ